MATKRSILEVRQRPLLSALLLAVLYSLFYTLSLHINPEGYTLSTPCVIGSRIDVWAARHYILSSIFIFCGVLYLCVSLAQLASRFNIYGTSTHLPLEIYPLLMISTFSGVVSLRALILSLLLLRSLQRLFSSYRAANSSGALSLAALYMGVMPLIYPPAVVMWFTILPIMFIFERGGREVIVTFVTLLLPLFGYMYISWLGGVCFAQSAAQLIGGLELGGGISLVYKFSTVELISLVVMIILITLGVMSTSTLDNTVKSKHRISIITILIISILAMLAIPSVDRAIFPLLIIPTSLILPPLFLRLSRTLAFILYLIIVGAAVMECVGL